MPRQKTVRTKNLEQEIATVLSESGESLHYKEVAEAIGKKRTFKFGADPATEVYYAIYNDLNLHPKTTVFEKTGKALFALKSDLATHGQKVPWMTVCLLRIAPNEQLES